jgi:hypothetical protein
MTFIPAWAEKELGKTPVVDSVELITLREFFDTWNKMHTFPKDKLNNGKREDCAKVLLELRDVLLQMRHPKLGTLSLNGVKIG